MLYIFYHIIRAFSTQKEIRKPYLFYVSQIINILLLLHCTIALVAIYRLFSVRTERNLGILTTVSAYCREHLTVLARSSARVLASITAGLASLRLIHKAFLCIKLLLACGEDEFLSTVLALNGLVLVHWFLPHLKWYFTLNGHKPSLCYG